VHWYFGSPPLCGLPADGDEGASPATPAAPVHVFSLRAGNESSIVLVGATAPRVAWPLGASGDSSPPRSPPPARSVSESVDGGRTFTCLRDAPASAMRARAAVGVVSHEDADDGSRCDALVIVGGEFLSVTDADAFTDSVLISFDRGRSWVEGPALPTPVRGATLVPLPNGGGAALLVGGERGDGSTDAIIMGFANPSCDSSTIPKYLRGFETGLGVRLQPVGVAQRIDDKGTLRVVIAGGIVLLEGRVGGPAEISNDVFICDPCSDITFAVADSELKLPSLRLPYEPATRFVPPSALLDMSGLTSTQQLPSFSAVSPICATAGFDTSNVFGCMLLLRGIRAFVSVPDADRKIEWQPLDSVLQQPLESSEPPAHYVGGPLLAAAAVAEDPERPGALFVFGPLLPLPADSNSGSLILGPGEGSFTPGNAIVLATPCKSSCEPGSFSPGCLSGPSTFECAPCAQCVPGKSFRKSPCVNAVGYGRDTICVPCTSCAAAGLETERACSLTADAVCRPPANATDADGRGAELALVAAPFGGFDACIAVRLGSRQAASALAAAVGAALAAALLAGAAAVYAGAAAPAAARKGRGAPDAAPAPSVGAGAALGLFARSLAVALLAFAAAAPGPACAAHLASPAAAGALVAVYAAATLAAPLLAALLRSVTAGAGAGGREGRAWGTGGARAAGCAGALSAALAERLSVRAALAARAGALDGAQARAGARLAWASVLFSDAPCAAAEAAAVALAAARGAGGVGAAAVAAALSLALNAALFFHLASLLRGGAQARLTAERRGARAEAAGDGEAEDEAAGEASGRASRPSRAARPAPADGADGADDVATVVSPLSIAAGARSAGAGAGAGAGADASTRTRQQRMAGAASAAAPAPVVPLAAASPLPDSATEAPALAAPFALAPAPAPAPASAFAPPLAFAQAPAPLPPSPYLHALPPHLSMPYFAALPLPLPLSLAAAPPAGADAPHSPLTPTFNYNSAGQDRLAPHDLRPPQLSRPSSFQLPPQAAAAPPLSRPSSFQLPPAAPPTDAGCDSGGSDGEAAPRGAAEYHSRIAALRAAVLRLAHDDLASAADTNDASDEPSAPENI